jgi:hypothetical protein
MDTTVVDKQIAALRTQDDLIGERLSQVDSQLEEWLEAAEQAQTALVTRAKAAGYRVNPPQPTESVPAVSSTPEAAAAPDPAEQSEEEALLDSLDPETQRVIRVKRRLTRGARSVSDLLAEYRAARPLDEDKSARRRAWWRRKDG